MADRPTVRISSRKQPKQARSEALVAAILEAAAQVLAEEGAARFTTARVAEKAGVSIGSLYQYFPNKAAILFRLQSEEWRTTATLVSSILDDRTQPAAVRLRRLVQAFLRSECEEAALRTALGDAAPLYRAAPEAVSTREGGRRSVVRFMAEVLPEARPAERDLAGSLITTTLLEVGRRFSESPRGAAEIERYADAMAEMFIAYLARLAVP